MANKGGNSTKQRPEDERFWEKVDASGDCWEWTGAIKSNGYGNFCPIRSITVLAHRYAWEDLVGLIPENMVLDHLCKNRRCVNPDHLEIVSPAINARRAWLGRKKALCRRGHPLSGDNVLITSAGRLCRICRKAYRRPTQHAA